MAFKTEVVWNRLLTDEEFTARQEYLATAVANGVTDGTVTFSTGDAATAVGTRVWTTEEAANSWVTYCNTLTPAPTSAVVAAV